MGRALLTAVQTPPESVTIRVVTPPARKSSRAERRAAASLARGDRKALERVWADHERTVLGYLMNALGDRGRAEDVRQQVMLEVWQRGAEYDPGRGGLLTWIMAIARSRAVDERRRRVPEPRDPAGDHATAADHDSDPDALVERWTVAHLLRRLRTDDAELLRLRFYSGLSQREIAERRGLPVGTVKTRMVAALRQLRELVDAESPELRPRPSAEPAAVRAQEAEA